MLTTPPKSTGTYDSKETTRQSRQAFTYDSGVMPAWSGIDEEEDLDLRGRLHAALDRLRRTHLERGSVYIRVRSLLPVATLLVLWLCTVEHDALLPAIRHSGFTSWLSSLLDRSLSLRQILAGALVLAVWNISLALSPHRRRSIALDLLAEISRLLFASLAGGLVVPLVKLAHHTPADAQWSGLVLAVSLIFASLLLLLAAFAVSARLLPEAQQKKALIIGSGGRADELRARLEATNTRLQIIGCLDDEYLGTDPIGDKYRGPLSNLGAILKKHPVQLVLIGLPVKSKYQQIQDVIAVCESVGVESHYLADIFAAKSVPQPSNHSSEFTVLSSFTADARLVVKRLGDILASLILIVLTLPLMLAAAIAIKLTSPGPVFFVQKRYGLHRKQFGMLKFRSMHVNAEQQIAALEAFNEAKGPVFKMKSDPRVTRVGSILRRTSIDELPQLFNVLRGEMSLVGPRPLPVRDVNGFNEPWLLRRFSVRPGLTCLWQVGGRSNVSFEEWMALDLKYIDEWSLAGDLVILARTVPAVLRGSGAV